MIWLIIFLCPFYLRISPEFIFPISVRYRWEVRTKLSTRELFVPIIPLTVPWRGHIIPDLLMIWLELWLARTELFMLVLPMVCLIIAEFRLPHTLQSTLLILTEL